MSEIVHGSQCPEKATQLAAAGLHLCSVTPLVQGVVMASHVYSPLYLLYYYSHHLDLSFILNSLYI